MRERPGSLAVPPFEAAERPYLTHPARRPSRKPPFTGDEADVTLSPAVDRSIESGVIVVRWLGFPLRETDEHRHDDGRVEHSRTMRRKANVARARTKVTSSNQSSTPARWM